MTVLRIASDLTLPIEAVTETFAILAKRGVGKTYTASVMAEEMLDAGAQVVILDPLDAWWGLRSSADGKGEGVPIYVFGGEHADLPLESTAGELVADVVVDHGISVICSLRHLTKSKQRQFVTAFAERLYHRKGEPEHRTPLHVFIDEADAFVPQRVMQDTAKMVGAIDDIVRRGRSAGLGATLISQRAAVVNKDVLTQCEVLVALRTISPQDRKALDDWVEAHDAHDQRSTFMGSIAGLDVGEAWVWSPGWLDMFQRVHIRKRRTFDSSSTPKAGKRAAAPAKRAPVDLADLEKRMAATIAAADAVDPRKLQARIRELERQLATPAKPELVEKVVEVPTLPPEVERAIPDLVAWQGVLGDAHGGVSRVITLLQSAANGSGKSRIRQLIDADPFLSKLPERSEPPLVRMRDSPLLREAMRPDPDRPLGKAERTLLNVLAAFPAGRSRVQLSILSGYSIKSSGFANAIGRLRSLGLVERGEPLVITEVGLGAAGPVTPMPTGPELRSHWMARLGKAERTILEVVVDAYPDELTREEISARSGYSLTSSGFANAIGRLRSLQLIVGLRASEDLF